MAFKHGKDSVFKVDNSAGSLTDISAYTDSVDGLPGGISTAETTTFGDSAKESIVGLKDAVKVSASGPWDITLDAHLGTIYNNGGDTAAGGSLSLQWSPEGTSASSPKFEAECWLTEYTTSSKVDGRVEWKATFEVTGGVTRGTH